MIGILGGTFDPVHEGHFHLATQVHTRLGLEQVQFMPCAVPVHRSQPHASATDRCAMIELMIADQAAFALNTLELDRSGPSYSVDSLRQIREQCDATLVMVVGADAFNDFASWKSPQEILRLAHLAVCYRPGFEVDQNIFSQHRVETTRELVEQPTGAILMLEVDAIDCSSSAVRAALETGNLPGRCLHLAVASYIDKHNLYRKKID